MSRSTSARWLGKGRSSVRAELHEQLDVVRERELEAIVRENCLQCLLDSLLTMEADYRLHRVGFEERPRGPLIVVCEFEQLV